MAINKAMRAALKALSYDGAKDIYKLQRTALELKSPHLTRSLYEKWDRVVVSGDREVPIRVYPAPKDGAEDRLILFFHGGGWVTENVNTYNAVCKAMASRLKCRVVSVDYRLAPEYPFPCGLEDCYTVARELFLHPQFLGVPPENITLVGDSAGGNLAAALSLMARDRGEFRVSRQVLIYPATYNDHGDDSPFASVRENGTDYLLTSAAVQDYMELYESDPADRENPYFAPLLCPDLSNQPDTLVITAEYDPLRDEGEEYGFRLRRSGNSVRIFRMRDALHGFFSMRDTFAHVRKAYQLIQEFLELEDEKGQ